MTEHDKQFDDPQRQVSDQFRTDLRALFGPPGAVPPEVDRAILEQARRRLARPRRLIIRLRWAAGTAAAALIVIGVLLFNPQSAIRNPQLSRLDSAEGRADIDNNGRVDILDALCLARHIEAGDPAGPTPGGSADKDWDLNGDGRLDRDDVDVVAFAAVRLREGV
jgi:hypothetical protein